jgi:CIC family chloride channel protein
VPVRTAIGGLLVGTIALAYPQVMGVGYDSITQALVGSPAVTFLLAVLAAKLLAICITLGSGGSGGVFAPSLFLGALVGSLVGSATGALFPGHVASPGAYALVGMGAVVAGTTHAPITAILILFELTGDYRIILPLMTACIIATLLATRLSRESIYTLKLSRRGVHVRAGQDIDLLRRVPVLDVIRKDALLVPPNEPLEKLIREFSDAPGSSIYVVDADKKVRGVIAFGEMRQVLHEVDALRNLLVADDIATPRFPSVLASDTLDTVLKQLDLGYRDELPVLDDGCLVGVVHMEDVISRYRKEVLRR